MSALFDVLIEHLLLSVDIDEDLHELAAQDLCDLFVPFEKVIELVTSVAPIAAEHDEHPHAFELCRFDGCFDLAFGIGLRIENRCSRFFLSGGFGGLFGRR